MSDNLFTMDQEVEKQVEKDVLGGFAARESALYPMTIKTAFLGDYAGGSKYVSIVLEDDQGNYSEEECVWSIKTKGPTYIDKKTGKTKELIGFAKINSLAKLLTGKGLEQSVFETKVHEVYSKDAGAKVPTPLPTLTEWTGKVVHVGILKTVENKQTKSGDKYVATAETREVNSVDKWFNEDKKTLVEVEKGVEAKFYEQWEKANTDRVIDKTDKTLKAGPVGGTGAATAEPLKFD